MEDTAFSVPPDKLDRFAVLYGTSQEGALEEIDMATGGGYSNVSLYSGGHGLVSTAADYLRFAQFILNKGELDGVRLLGPKTVELMTTNHLPPAVLPMSMGAERMPGLGFGFQRDAGCCFFGHDGLCWPSWLERMGQDPLIVDFRTLVYQALVG